MSFISKTHFYKVFLLSVVISLSGCVGGYVRPYGNSGYGGGYYGNGYGNSYPIHQGANYGHQSYGYQQQGGYNQSYGYSTPFSGYRHHEHEHEGGHEGHFGGGRDRD
jgi:hypothetical protein